MQAYDQQLLLFLGNKYKLMISTFCHFLAINASVLGVSTFCHEVAKRGFLGVSTFCFCPTIVGQKRKGAGGLKKFV